MPAAVAVREVGNYDRHHAALNQLEECRAANGVNLVILLTGYLCRFCLHTHWYYSDHSVTGCVYHCTVV